MTSRGDAALLERSLREIENLRKASPYDEAFRRWREETEGVLSRLFGAASPLLEHFRGILFTPLFLTCRCDDRLFSEAYENGLREARDLVRRCLERIC